MSLIKTDGAEALKRSSRFTILFAQENFSRLAELLLVPIRSHQHFGVISQVNQTEFVWAPVVKVSRGDEPGLTSQVTRYR